MQTITNNSLSSFLISVGRLDLMKNNKHMTNINWDLVDPSCTRAKVTYDLDLSPLAFISIPSIVDKNNPDSRKFYQKWPVPEECVICNNSFHGYKKLASHYLRFRCVINKKSNSPIHCFTCAFMGSRKEVETHTEKTHLDKIDNIYKVDGKFDFEFYYAHTRMILFAKELPGSVPVTIRPITKEDQRNFLAQSKEDKCDVCRKVQIGSHDRRACVESEFSITLLLIVIVILNSTGHICKWCKVFLQAPHNCELQYVDHPKEAATAQTAEVAVTLAGKPTIMHVCIIYYFFSLYR
jgi:hypothetical protein